MSTKKDKFSSKDKNYMKLAINLARARKGLTGDNPSVGCVITKNEKIISIGQTGYNGRPHAETNAIAKHLVVTRTDLRSEETIEDSIVMLETNHR